MVAQGTDIEAFYRLHARAVHSYLVSLCRDRIRAEDLMQETFIKATQAMGGYRGGSPQRGCSVSPAPCSSTMCVGRRDDLRRGASSTHRRPVRWTR